MNKNNSIAVIGGDSRQLFAAQYLIETGFSVKVFACEHGKIPASAIVEKNLTNAVDADILVLPLPVSKNGKILNTPLSSNEISLKELTDSVNDSHTVFYGMGSAVFTKTIKAHAKFDFDYFTSDCLIYKNAYLTAEGILGIILSKLPVTVRGTKIAITGYGRIGSLCADMLKNLGADVFVYTGKKENLAKTYTKGINGRLFSSLYKDAQTFDCIINTVPVTVLNNDIIKNTSPECIIIESASAPYGVDFDSCVTNSRQLIKAFSLPGKTAPKSAGIIIAETIIEKLQEVNL